MNHARYLIAVVLLAPASALARPTAYLDVFYAPWAESEVSNPVFLDEADGDGYGLRLRVTPMPRFFVQAEWQRNTYESDRSDVEGSALRVGVGAPFFARKRLRAYGLLEGLRADFSDRRSDQALIDEDGFALHAGILLKPLEPLSLHAQAGLLELEDSDGHEFQAGAALKFDQRLGGFVDYRVSQVESIRGLGTPERVDYEFSELRIGLRFSFGRPE
jgi:hypothetical protein